PRSWVTVSQQLLDDVAAFQDDPDNDELRRRAFNRLRLVKRRIEMWQRSAARRRKDVGIADAIDAIMELKSSVDAVVDVLRWKHHQPPIEEDVPASYAANLKLYDEYPEIDLPDDDDMRAWFRRMPKYVKLSDWWVLHAHRLLRERKT
ncbi:MAG: hypothetical protein Q9223_003354, partial [Gallowayella weberi]